MKNDLDGQALDAVVAAFAGSFDVEWADSDAMTLDQEGMVVVQFRAKVPRFKTTASGEIVRVSVLGVKDAALVRNRALKDKLIQELGLSAEEPQLDLTYGTP